MPIFVFLATTDGSDSLQQISFQFDLVTLTAGFKFSDLILIVQQCLFEVGDLKNPKYQIDLCSYLIHKPNRFR